MSSFSFLHQPCRNKHPVVVEKMSVIGRIERSDWIKETNGIGFRTVQASLKTGKMQANYPLLGRNAVRIKSLITVIKPQIVKLRNSLCAYAN